MDEDQGGHLPGASPGGTSDGPPQDTSPPNTRFDDLDFVRFFSRHLVSLGCIYERRTEAGEWVEKRFFISSFVFRLKGIWHLATAGHVLEEIEQFLAQPGERNERFVLLDGFVPEAKYEYLLRAFPSRSLVSPSPIDLAGGPVTQRLMGTLLVSLR
jgi:hypothetical protein